MKQFITVILFLATIIGNAQVQELFEHHITASTGFNGSPGSATLLIDDANGDNLITNPLIIAEGFDAGAITSPEIEFGDTNIETFIDDIEESDSDELRDLLTNSTQFTYGDQDYDIIYVNWDNGVADMRLNSLVLEEVINWVNEEKVGGAPNVLLGQSMGGVDEC